MVGLYSRPTRPAIFRRWGGGGNGSGGGGNNGSGAGNSSPPGSRFMGAGAAGSVPLTSYRNKIIIVLIATVIYTTFLYRSGGARHFLGNLGARPDPAVQQQAAEGMLAMINKGAKLHATTWNIAAINNNPFEYWITYKENPAYEKLMVDVEQFLENPGDKDVPVSDVFTAEMFAELNNRLTQTAGWKSVQSYWDSDFSKRKIISEFMKDPLLGSKRLASMPDRITNTINTAGGQGQQQAFRPTVINMYEQDLSTQAIWWKAWEAFMFDTPLDIKQKDGTVKSLKPYEMLQPIKKAKYPKITEQEEKDSLPLQTMCGAIFDAILVYMMNTVSKPEDWQPLKRTMVESLNKQKVPNTLNILADQYSESDIVTLQEVSAALIDQARQHPVLGDKYHIVSSSNLDVSRDQNSVVFLKKSSFPAGVGEEITSAVEETFPADTPVAKGDLLAVTAVHALGVPLVVASFHGDTNGLATIPVLNAVVETMTSDSKLISHKLIFGLDANTYENAKKGAQQDVLEFAQSYVKAGLNSCWGKVPDPRNYTTYNARTYLQPQLNKACKSTEKRAKGDVNPKDFILFGDGDFEVLQTWKDNTGKKEYVEDMAFPTLQFPSDHGILSTIVQPKATSAGGKKNAK